MPSGLFSVMVHNIWLNDKENIGLQLKERATEVILVLHWMTNQRLLWFCVEFLKNFLATLINNESESMKLFLGKHHKRILKVIKI